MATEEKKDNLTADTSEELEDILAEIEEEKEDKIPVVASDDRQLTSTEIDEMLKEAEESHQSYRRPKSTSATNRKKKKKSKVRVDMIIAAIIGLAFVLGVVALVVHFTKKTGEDSGKTNIENPLMDEKYPEISDVVKNYLNAYLIDDSQKRLNILAQYVDNMGDINDVEQNKYVDNYSNIECYTKEGPYENTYVVYAYYEIEFKNISTPAPTITTLYVMRDAKTGNVYIHNGVSTEIDTYIKRVSKDEDVQELFAETNKDFQDALSVDERLADFMAKLQKKPEATTAKADETKSGETTKETTKQDNKEQQATKKEEATKASEKKND